MASPVFASLSTWNALERAVDRWASFGALAVAALAAVLFSVLR